MADTWTTLAIVLDRMARGSTRCIAVPRPYNPSRHSSWTTQT
jgi:hypothetical protein